jgi:thiol-disulfide isomerase/thioredoxin
MGGSLLFYLTFFIMKRTGLTTLLGFLLIISTLQAQTLNKMVYDTILEQKVMIDYCDRSGLETGEFGTYFLPEYKAYEANDSLVQLLKGKINDYQITIVFGSWCSDSQEQVPRFYKILDQAGYDENNLTVIAVNRGKHTEEADISGLDIERVPTFIVYKHGEEAGRIIETPENTLEEDLWKIVR